MGGREAWAEDGSSAACVRGGTFEWRSCVMFKKRNQVLIQVICKMGYERC